MSGSPFPPGAPGTQLPPTKKSRKGLVIGIVAGVIVLVLGGAVAAGVVSAAKSISWQDDHRAASQKLASDLNAIGTSASAFNDLGNNPDPNTVSSDFAAMKAACSRVQQDASTDLNWAPFPDAGTQAELHTALTTMQRAASECITGSDNQDAAMLDQSSKDFETSGNEFDAFAKSANLN